MLTAAFLTLVAFTPAMLVVAAMALWCDIDNHSVDAIAGTCHRCGAQVLDPIGGQR